MAGAKARNLDFSNVKEGGNFNKARIPAGDYAAIITKVEDAVAKDNTDQYLFSIKIKSRASSVLPYYCKLQENQLWKLRNIFIAAGKTVPKKRMKVDPNQIVGKLIGVTVEDTEWEDKEQSEIAAVFPAADLGDDDAVSSSVSDDDEGDEDSGDEDDLDIDTASDDDEAEEAEEDSEEEEAEEADPYADLDRTELKKQIKALQADFVAKKSQSDDDLREILRGLASADADEDEEEEAPAPKATKKRKAKVKADELSDDDIDELNIDDL